MTRPVKFTHVKKQDMRQATGLAGEDLAARHLESLGYRVIARRYRVRVGEIDLVASRPGLLVFIEVKTRRQTRFGTPAESVRRQKQVRITRAAEQFLLTAATASHEGFSCRFDVIAITFHADSRVHIEHLEDAFRPGA